MKTSIISAGLALVVSMAFAGVDTLHLLASTNAPLVASGNLTAVRGPVTAGATNLIIPGQPFFDLAHPIQVLTNFFQQGVAAGPTNLFSINNNAMKAVTFNNVDIPGYANNSLSNGIPVRLNHFSDGCYDNGLLYIPAEYYVSGGADYPGQLLASNSIVAIFNASNLTLNSWFAISNQVKSASAVCINTNTGVIYCSDWGSKTNIAKYDLTTHSFLGYLSLNFPLTGDQGMDVKNGLLYLSSGATYASGDGALLFTFFETNGAMACPPVVLYPNTQAEPEGLSFEGTNLIVGTGNNTRGYFVFNPLPPRTNQDAPLSSKELPGFASEAPGSDLSSGVFKGSLGDGLLLYFPFSETESAVMHDGSPSHIDGGYGATNTTGFLGVSGYGLKMDGTAMTGALVPPDARLTGLTNMTVNVWVSATNNPSRWMVFNKHIANFEGEYFLEALSGTQLQWTVVKTNDSGRNNLMANIPSLVSSPTHVIWHMITVEHSTDQGLDSLYFDGAFVTNSINPSPINSYEELGICIGNLNFVSQFWKGGIDEFSMWKRALTPAEISTLYERQNPPKRLHVTF